MVRIIREDEFMALHFDDRLPADARFECVEISLAAKPMVLEDGLRVIVSHDGPQMRACTPMNGIALANGPINRPRVRHARQSRVFVEAWINSDFSLHCLT